jgi:hypothetical protein
MSTSPIDPRIVSVESQIGACMRGATNLITCPFCGAQNKAENEALCCVDFGAVVQVVLRKQALQEVMDTAARIADSVGRN